MKRPQLEHIIRAAGSITGATEVVVIGSQAILGQFPDAPDELLTSLDADVFTLRSPRDAEVIDGAIGELSAFHQSFGYYAHGVGIETAFLPDGWETRLVRLRTAATGNATGLCLEVHDLSASKLLAGREKDLDYVRVLLVSHLASVGTLRERLHATPAPAEVARRAIERLNLLAAGD